MSIEAMKQALERVDRAIEEPNITMSDGKALKEILRQLHLIKDTLRAAIAEASMQRLTDVQQEMEAPRREWAGLTDEEIDSWELPDCPTVFEFCQFIEAKLKEKNT